VTRTNFSHRVDSAKRVIVLPRLQAARFKQARELYEDGKTRHKKTYRDAVKGML